MKKKVSGTKQGLKLIMVHTLIAVVVLVALLIVGFHWLKKYTLHGEAFAVPDFYAMTEPDVAQLAQTSDLRYEIIDSVYVNTVAPGAVVDQNPAVGAFVKRDRTIFLTINAKMAEMVSMPDLVGLSLRQAVALLQMHGLRLGTFSYEQDIAFNNVLRQVYADRDIPTGEKIAKGASVNLVLGTGVRHETTTVPHLVGCRLTAARDSLLRKNLNVGELLYDTTVRTADDSLRAVVYRQHPASGYAWDPVSTPVGEPVSMWLTLDARKVSVEPVVSE